jgi:hypothetical protein
VQAHRGDAPLADDMLVNADKMAKSLRAHVSLGLSAASIPRGLP